MAEEKELTDSQLLDVARQLEHELKFKQNAALGLRQYVQVKQKKKAVEQEYADLQKKIEEQKRILTLSHQAHAQKMSEMDNEFTVKRAARERGFEDEGVRIGKEIESLKASVKSHEEAAKLAEKQSQEAIKEASAKQRKKLADFEAAEKAKIARNKILDDEYNGLQQSLSELREKHGLK